MTNRKYRVTKSGKLMVSLDGGPEREADLGDRIARGDEPTESMLRDPSVSFPDRRLVLNALLPLATDPARIRRLAWGMNPAYRSALSDEVIAEIADRLRSGADDAGPATDWTVEAVIRWTIKRVVESTPEYKAARSRRVEREHRRRFARPDRLDGLLSRLKEQAARSWKAVEFGFQEIGKRAVWGFASKAQAVAAAPNPGHTRSAWVDLLVCEQSSITGRKRFRMIGALEMSRGGAERTAAQALGLAPTP